MKQISYQVQGNAKDPYNITMSINNSKIKYRCDCPAGTYGKRCKHWMSIFSGKEQKYINLNEQQIEEIQSWLPGNDLGVFIELEKLSQQQKEIEAKKKKLIKRLDAAVEYG